MAGFQCSGCRKFQLVYTSRCRACGREGYLCGSHKFDGVSWQEMTTLAHNLAVAAFGCAAFEQGAIAYSWTLFGQDAWHPGCGRPAPRWTREEGR